jgi:hypothetical protein
LQRYGTNIYKQESPISNNGTQRTRYDTTGYTYDSGTYIGQDNVSDFFANIRFEPFLRYTETQNVQIKLRSVDTGVSYTITGDFSTSPLNGTLTTNTQTFNITLTAGTGTKRVYATVTSGTNVRTSSDYISYVIITDPYLQKYSLNARQTSGRVYNYNTCDPSKMSVTTLSP